MGSKSQRKGRRAEIELAGLLQGYGIPAQVGDPLNYGSQPDIKGVAGVHCEVKRCEQLRLSEWMAQATRDAEKFKDGAPTIFHRKSRSGWVAIMCLEDWAELYSRSRKCNT